MSGEHLRQQRRSAANALFSNRLQKALQDGRAWIYREYQTLASGGTFDVFLQNPETSDVSLLVSRFIEATGGHQRHDPR